MRVFASLLLLVLVALGAFVALNWSAIVAPGPVSLGFFAVQAPLGAILLGACAALIALFLLAAAYEKTVALAEARRHARELRAQRELADRAEASRFAELRTAIHADLDDIRSALGATGSSPTVGLGGLEGRLSARISDEANGLAAHIGEIEDKLDRALRWSAGGGDEITAGH